MQSKLKKNLIENRGFSPLHWASRNGHSKVCKILIENQAEKNVINTIGWMLLYWASCSRHSEVCKNCTWKLSGKKFRCSPLTIFCCIFFGTFRSLLVSKCNQNPLKNLLHVLFWQKRFAQNSKMKIRERNHTGEKPYSCLYCDKRFAKSSELKSYETTHTE